MICQVRRVSPSSLDSIRYVALYVWPLYGVSFMTIDDETFKQLLRIHDELIQLCMWLNEKHDMETSSRLIPLVDDLTHILVEAGKNKLH
jgi:hypothetical protein